MALVADEYLKLDWTDVDKECGYIPNYDEDKIRLFEYQWRDNESQVAPIPSIPENPTSSIRAPHISELRRDASIRIDNFSKVENGIYSEEGR